MLLIFTTILIGTKVCASCHLAPVVTSCEPKFQSHLARLRMSCQVVRNKLVIVSEYGVKSVDLIETTRACTRTKSAKTQF